MNAKQVLRVVLLKILPMIVGFAALGLTIAWLAGVFTSKIEPGEQAPVVRRLTDQRTDTVHEVTKDYYEEAIGTLRSAIRTTVSAKVLATIEKISVTAGDHVQQGDVLMLLDSKELEARQKQAEQTLAAAVASRTQAEQNYNRIKSLHERGAVPQAELDEAVSSLDVSRAEESRAQQAIDEAKAQLSYATITAPKSGRVVDRLAEEGDMARPGEPLLVLYDPTSLRLEAPVPESLAVQLQVGQKLEAYIDALDRKLEATIDEQVPQADAPSRSFLVKAKLPHAPDLYEGLFGRLLIPAGQRRHLCLATDAIRKLGQLEFVDVVLPDRTLERRLIKTGRLGMPGRVEVLSGLKANETVVLHGDPSAQQPSDER